VLFSVPRDGTEIKVWKTLFSVREGRKERTENKEGEKVVYVTRQFRKKLTKINILKFADDTKIFSAVNNTMTQYNDSDRRLLQKDLDNLLM